MTRNEILDVAGKFYKPETITEREVAFARHMIKHEREACASTCDKVALNLANFSPSCIAAVNCAEAIRARGEA